MMPMSPEWVALGDKTEKATTVVRSFSLSDGSDGNIRRCSESRSSAGRSGGEDVLVKGSTD